MAFKHGSKAVIYLNGFNLSGWLKEFQSSFSVDTAETSTFGNTFKTYVPGLSDGTFTASGIYDGDTNAVDVIMLATLQATKDDIVAYLPQGDGLGNPAKCFASMSTSYQVTSSIGDVSTVQLQGQSQVGSESGLLLHAMGAEATPGNGTSVDQTVVSTSAGWSSYIQVISGTDLVVKIQDSANNSTWADLSGAVFPEFDARGGARIYNFGTAVVRRYVRAIWTGTGTFQVMFNRKLT